MGNYKGFEDLDIWKEGIDFSVEVYKVFKECKDFGLKDQIQRASVSIPSNIAEGYERQTDKELIQFLYIAKGSCGEVRTQLIIAQKTRIIDENNSTILIQQSKILSSKILNFIKYIKSRPN